jgi:hypothetical protein
MVDRRLRIAVLLAPSFFTAPMAWGAPRSSSSEPTARLVYECKLARNDCPDERSFRALVTARLGRDPFADRAERSLRVTVLPDSGGIVGRADLTGEGAPRQERTIRSSLHECEALVEALASVVALNLTPRSDPEKLPPLPPPAEPPTARTASDLAPPATAPVRELGATGADADRRRGTAEPASAVRFAARAAVVTSFGLLPGASIGGELGAGFARGWFSLVAMGRGETQIGQATGVSGEKLDAAMFSGGVMPCLSAAWFSGCGTAWIGVLQGRAPEAASSALGSSTTAFVGARIGADIPLGAGLRLAPQVELWVPLVRTTLVYAQTPTWTAPALLGSAGVGLVYIPGP